MAELIRDLEHLKDLSRNRMLECFINLKGNLRSSKIIQFFPETNSFSIINEADDTEDDVTVEELFDTSKTNVGDALNKKALYKY